MTSLSINHLSNRELVSLFAFLPTSDIQLVSRRWMNVCTTYFPKKYHLKLIDVSLSSRSDPVQLFKTSKRVIECLTLSNVELEFNDDEDFTEVLLFLKRLNATVTELILQHSIKPNIDLIRGFQKVQKLVILSPGWYIEIANGKISFPEVRILRLSGFNIDIFGKNMFCSFFKKFSYVEEIEIDGDVIEKYSQFGTYFGQKLKQIHFHVEHEQLAAKTVEFLTIIKGIELRHLTFVITNPFDVEIFGCLITSHPSLQVIEVISQRGFLPNPHPKIKSCEILLKDEYFGVFKELELFSGLTTIDIQFPWKQNRVQINCFFGHENIARNPNITTLKVSGFNKDCPTCFTNMTVTFPNLKTFEYTSAVQIDIEIVQQLGENLPKLEELSIICKDYEKVSKPGFAKYFEMWPRMRNLKKLKLEPLSWQWTEAGVMNLGISCPFLETLHLDGGVDIDDSFLQSLLCHLHHLEHLTIGDTFSRAFDIPTHKRLFYVPSLAFLFPEELTPDRFFACQTIPLVENFQQPCPKLKELRLLTCTLDMSLKLRLFQNFKMLRVVQDRKTLLTYKQFHDMRDQFQQEFFDVRATKRRGGKVKRFLQKCFC